MKKLIHKLFVLVIPIILILILIFTTSKYCTSITLEGRGIIAEPIIVLESFENTEKVVNKLDFPKTYDFKIKNYNTEKVNEVDFLYNIELECSDTKFPIKYTLIDLTNNEIISLENNKTRSFKILKDKKEEKEYRLLIEWENKKIKLDEMFNIKAKININQYKIGEYISE